MQLKPLIIVIVVAMFLLLVFNIINGNRHENNRAVTVHADTAVDTNASGADMNSASSATDITSKPLGEQPKAIMDKATTQIDSAQQADKERLAQMDSAQQ